MDISLIHAGMAGGAALAALPVILHLFMKQKPKRVIFPALRLIRERQKRSRKKLKVKNWLLLLARMAVLALMALALARPRVVTQASVGDADVPTAIGMVFDTSQSMSYTQPDKSRLDLAKEWAFEHLKKTPSSSVVYVVDSAEPGVPPPLSPAAARKRIEGLEIRPANRLLNSAVGQAYAAVTASDKPSHEVYILTDLAQSSWDMKRPADGLDKAAKDKNLRTFVLRLTPRDIVDVSVIEVKPANEVVTEGEPVEIVAKVRALGPSASRVAELRLDGAVKEKKTIDVPAGGVLDVRFTIPKTDASTPIHQGDVRLTGPKDPMKFNDLRSFSFTVKPAPRVLVVADDPRDGEFLMGVVDPTPAPAGIPRPFRAEFIPSARFVEKSANLGKTYRCIFLNNVAELSEAEWGKLNGFVRDGGGLVVGLGRKSLAANYNATIAAQILPASLEKPVFPKSPTTFGDVADLSHPLFDRYPKELTAMLAQIPVFKYWGVKPQEGSRTLVSYADKAPALVERVFKGSRTGRVLLWTTPLSRRPDALSPDAWNEFPSDVLGWSYYYLMNQSVSYLAGTAEESLNFEAGRDVILPIDPAHRYKNYIVQDPDKKSSDRLSPPENSDALVIFAPQHLGNWTVRASGTEGNGTVTGFSVNPSVSESEFVPLEKAELDRLLGEKKYALADDKSEIDHVIQTIRVGRELFPWLMMLIMIIVVLEGILANRFYREVGPGGGQAPAARQAA